MSKRLINFAMQLRCWSFSFDLVFSFFQRNGWIELALVEAKDLIAADLNGTSDPYVRVQYGNLKKRTKVRYALTQIYGLSQSK